MKSTSHHDRRDENVPSAALLLLVGGERVAGGGAPLEVEDPFSATTLTRLPVADDAQVDAAVAAARAAARAWGQTPAAERGAMLHELARRLRARTDDIARVMTLEGGKPFVENRDELRQAAGTLDYFAELGRSSAGRVVPPVEPTQLSLVVREPIGVVACITPWNFPVLLLIWKLAPALAAGNTLVCKPSELTPLSTLMLAECVEHLPAGVVNFVAGAGDVGQALVDDERVDCVAFTGSIETGRKVAAGCATRLARVNLELGGKDPFIVCSDMSAELDVVARAGAWTAYFNAGQVCSGAERFYVPADLHDEFVERLVARSDELVIGDPLEATTDVGPLISRAQREKVIIQLEQAVAAGAQILSGGSIPEGAGAGHFLSPTVVSLAPLATPLLDHETFGPVAPVVRVRGLDHAIEQANSTSYGLGCSVFTRDIRNIVRCIRELRTGMIWFNDPLTENDASPFGGVKQSGLGRELGEEGLAAFQETKRVHIESHLGVKDWWFPYGGG